MKRKLPGVVPAGVDSGPREGEVAAHAEDQLPDHVVVEALYIYIYTYIYIYIYIY